MKKQLLIILLSLMSLAGLSQTVPSLPGTAVPYGNQLYLDKATGFIYSGNAGYKFRVIGSKRYIDSLLAANWPLYQLRSEKGFANGYASLDGSGKIPLSQINDALIGSVNYRGSYNVVTNTPTLPSVAPGNKGNYYIVSNLKTVFQGDSVFAGDWIISNGAVWQALNQSNRVTSVNGRVGNVNLKLQDVSRFISEDAVGNINVSNYMNVGGSVSANNINVNSGGSVNIGGAGMAGTANGHVSIFNQSNSPVFESMYNLGTTIRPPAGPILGDVVIQDQSSADIARFKSLDKSLDVFGDIKTSANITGSNGSFTSLNSRQGIEISGAGRFFRDSGGYLNVSDDYSGNQYIVKGAYGGDTQISPANKTALGNAGDVVIQGGASEIARFKSSDKSLTVSGNGIFTAKFRTAIFTATTTQTISGHTTICNASSGSFTINLTLASYISGIEYVIKKIDSSANTITIKANGSETIDGSNTVVLSAQWKYVKIQSDGTAWYVIGSN